MCTTKISFIVILSQTTFLWELVNIAIRYFGYILINVLNIPQISNYNTVYYIFIWSPYFVYLMLQFLCLVVSN